MIKYKKSLLSMGAVALLLSSCAHRHENPHHVGMAKDPEEVTDYDPLEGFNRFIFGFNYGLDIMLLKPAATIYKETVHVGIRNMVRDFLRNLKSPITLGNNLLQGDLDAANNTLVRFVVNSTVGIGGLFDAAEPMGHTYAAADFGQTLGIWGAGPGPYLMLPIIGPSTFRDGLGFAVDTVSDPLTIYARNTDRDWIIYSRAGATLLDKRTELLPVTNDLEQNSLDYYSALRSYYLQSRKALIEKNHQHQENLDYPDYPDYDAQDSLLNKDNSNEQSAEFDDVSVEPLDSESSNEIDSEEGTKKLDFELPIEIQEAPPITKQ